MRKVAIATAALLFAIWLGVPSRIACPVDAATAQVKRIAEIVMLYRLDHGRYPASLGALSPGYAAPTALIDAWNSPLHYDVDRPESDGFDVYTYGADGRPGGEGPNADRHARFIPTQRSPAS